MKVHPDGRASLLPAAVGDPRWSVHAHPDPAGQAGGVADKPGVLVIVGGSGFAGSGNGKTERHGGGGGALSDDVSQIHDVVHVGIDAAKFRAGRLVDRLAVAILNRLDDVWLSPDAIVRETSYTLSDL